MNMTKSLSVCLSYDLSYTSNSLSVCISSSCMSHSVEIVEYACIRVYALHSLPAERLKRFERTEIVRCTATRIELTGIGMMMFFGCMLDNNNKKKKYTKIG